MIDQSSQFMAILTAVGEAKQANAAARGLPWTFTQMGVGDANGADPQPSRTQTKLINERRRAPLNQIKVDPKNTNVIIAEQVIPENVGGWWIREIGLYDADGDLVAVANCAPSFKPLLAQGSGKTQVVRMNFIVTSAANVVLKIDPSVVLATRQYVDDRIIEVLPSTRAAGTYQKVTINERGIVTEGSNPDTLEGHGIVIATQPEAETGKDNVKPMTPLRVAQVIAKNARGFVEGDNCSIAGFTAGGTLQYMQRKDTGEVVYLAARKDTVLEGITHTPTVNEGVSDNQIANTEFVKRAISRTPKNTAVMGENGWWRCADTGLIRQRRKVVVNDIAPTTRADVVWPLQFPNECSSIVITFSQSSAALSPANASAMYVVSSKSNYSCQIAFHEWVSEIQALDLTLYVQAEGY
ncbi:phage tail protein [Pseudomonas fragi]|uniref:phage tail protein n=1 Tax=Pseudomonas fragi TaxID=296 RepID=UPI0021CF8053|nr:phage tail protein [Pseudomonas fragi]